MPPVSLGEIQQASRQAEGIVVRTPVVEYFGSVPGNNSLWLKAENLQRTASFKFRGAYNAVSTLTHAERACGVITYSSGNHGQAVACAAHMVGARAVVVMPEDAIPVKVALTRHWGAEVVFAGLGSADRYERALQLANEHGYTVIPPFDDPRIISGQGTAGLEILEQLADVQAVLVPVGGGGLLSGIATAVKALRSDVKVIGVEPEGAADARDSLRSGRITTWNHIDTVADGLRTSHVGALNFATIQELVDDIVTVSEKEILMAVGLLAREAKLVVEPSGATGPAAALFGRSGRSSEKLVALISGGNVDAGIFISCLDPAVSAVAGSVS